MGAAFTIPCLDNNHKVTLCEPYNFELVKKILSKKNFHPALKLNLPKKLVVKKFSQEILKKMMGPYSYSGKLYWNRFN